MLAPTTATGLLRSALSAIEGREMGLEIRVLDLVIAEIR